MFTEKLFDEEQIVSLVTQGDEIAFAKLFDHYRDKVYSVALKLTHSVILAEEVVENVFLKIWLKRENLLQVHNFNAYLSTIARHDVYKAVKRIAKDYKVTGLDESTFFLTPNYTEDPESYLMEKEYNHLLEKAVARLPNQQRQVYRLIKEQDLKREVVASILNLQPETVKFHLAQAMKNIRSFCLIHLDLKTGLIICLFYLTR